MALNPGTNHMEHDPQLSADYRLAATEAPPAAVDERIRAAARREVGAGPQRTSHRRAWQKPLSLAAVVVLSVTIVLMMRDEGVDRVEPELPPPAADVMSPQTAIDPAAKQGPAPQARPPASPPARPAADGKLQEKPAPAEASPSMMAKSQSVVEAPAVAAAPRLEEPAPAERNVVPVREAARPMLRSAPAATAADAAAGPAARVAAPAALSAPVAAQPLWHDLVKEPAEKWLQRIAEWRRAGRTADADLLATEFRRRFPDQALPEEPVAK